MPVLVECDAVAALAVGRRQLHQAERRVLVAYPGSTRTMSLIVLAGCAACAGSRPGRRRRLGYRFSSEFSDAGSRCAFNPVRYPLPAPRKYPPLTGLISMGTALTMAVAWAWMVAAPRT